MLKKWIKNYDDPTDPKVRAACGKLAGVVGIVANLLLFCVKIAVGLFSSSISVIADSLNNLSDAGSSVLTVFGYAITGKPADKKHPYGHARMEYLCGLFISVIVAFLGVEMLTSSVKKLLEGGSTEKYSYASIIIIGSTILVKLAIGLFFGKIGKHIDSVALRAASADSISDMFTTAAVVVGMLLTPVTGPLTDGILGCLIAVYILFVGVKLILESSHILLGEAPDEKFVADIVSKLKSYDGVLGIHDLVIHSYGANRCFASVHVEVDADRDILEAHDSMDVIEDDFRREKGIHLVVHMDPICTSDEETNRLREQVTALVKAVSAEQGTPLSLHDFRIVKGITHTNVLFDIAVESECPVSDEALTELLRAKVRAIDPTYHTILTVDRDYFSNRIQ